MNGEALLGAFAFGFVCGGLVVEAMHKKNNEARAKKVLKICEMSIYLSSILEKYNVPIDEFDVIVLQTIAQEAKSI